MKLAWRSSKSYEQLLDVTHCSMAETISLHCMMMKRNYLMTLLHYQILIAISSTRSLHHRLSQKFLCTKKSNLPSTEFLPSVKIHRLCLRCTMIFWGAWILICYWRHSCLIQGECAVSNTPMLWRDGRALEAAWNILLNVEMFDFHHRWNHEVRVIVYEIVLSSIVLTFVTLSYWIDAWPDFCTELVSYKS